VKNFCKTYQFKKCPEYCPLECDIINRYNEQFPGTGNISLKVKSDVGLIKFQYSFFKEFHFLSFIEILEIKYMKLLLYYFLMKIKS
jgi:hypothetical protein